MWHADTRHCFVKGFERLLFVSDRFAKHASKHSCSFFVCQSFGTQFVDITIVFIHRFTQHDHSTVSDIYSMNERSNLKLYLQSLSVPLVSIHVIFADGGAHETSLFERLI